MITHLSLQADARLGREEIRSALGERSAVIVESDDGMSGLFCSGMSFAWIDGGSMSFRLAAPSQAECMSEVHEFVLNVSRTSPASFIVFGRGEKILAMRDDTGLVLHHESFHAAERWWADFSTLRFSRTSLETSTAARPS
jgi:hypothetical protein